MLIPDALFCLSSSLIACWSLWPILLCQTCMHSALYFTLCPSITFSNFCETFSSNSPLCSVASAIVSPFFVILHNFFLSGPLDLFQLVSLRKLDFHIAEVHRAHHITWPCD